MVKLSKLFGNLRRDVETGMVERDSTASKLKKNIRRMLLKSKLTIQKRTKQGLVDQAQGNHGAVILSRERLES